MKQKQKVIFPTVHYKKKRTYVTKWRSNKKVWNELDQLSEKSENIQELQMEINSVYSRGLLHYVWIYYKQHTQVTSDLHLFKCDCVFIDMRNRKSDDGNRFYSVLKILKFE